jgi:lipopolysaccharide/colanic/teichoic acid biosynthesis glycosyltransferase
VGRILRATTIDELPQLANVLSGAMSLVGPRPALPEEVAVLDPRHHVRFLVPPGISGLWQVEARDNPASGPYQRLDQFYVENWSIGLDLSIALATVSTAVARSARMLLTLAREPRPALPARSHR